MTAFYPADYYAYNENYGAINRLLVAVRVWGRGRQYRTLLQGRPGRLFDVGTGDCRHFENLRRFCELECAGVEINSDLAAVARSRGYDVTAGTLEVYDAASRAGNYDLVSMNHVLEHVIEPRVVLAKVYQLLRPGGYLLGQLPAIDSWERRAFGATWGGYDFPRHLQLFSRRALTETLLSAGFVDISVESAPHLQAAISVQNLLVSRGWKMRMRYGKCRLYGAFLLGVMPFETVAYLAGRSGVIDFRASKPLQP